MKERQLTRALPLSAMTSAATWKATAGAQGAASRAQRPWRCRKSGSGRERRGKDDNSDDVFHVKSSKNGVQAFWMDRGGGVSGSQETARPIQDWSG